MKKLSILGFLALILVEVSACSKPGARGADLKMELYYPAEDISEQVKGKGYLEYSDSSDLYGLDLHFTASGDTDVFLSLFRSRERNFSFKIYQHGDFWLRSTSFHVVPISGPYFPEPGDSWNFVWEAPYYPNGKSGMIATATVTFVPEDSYREY